MNSISIHLSGERKIVLEKFRDLFKNEPLVPEKSDNFLLRWLIARDFNLADAEKMLRDSLEWRKQNGLDNKKADENYVLPEVMVKYMPIGVVGCNPAGNPLVLLRLGIADLKGICCSISPQDYIKYVTKGIMEDYWLTNTNNTEKDWIKINDDGSNMGFRQATLIFDLKEFGIRHVTARQAIENTMQICKVYEANYPEMLRKVFIINAPKVFDLVFTLIKPFLHEGTQNKIQIFGHDSDVWKAALVAEIPTQMLPVCYGGALTDPVDGNPDCSSLVNMGGDVPKSYYLNHNQTSNQMQPDGKGQLLVKGRSKEFLEIRVEEADTILQWEFYSEDGDAAFSVTRKNGHELMVLIPHERVDCHLSKRKGQIRCEEPGTYVLEFDNSFSYFRSKRISYSIKLE